MLKSGGRQVGETILYYGCRDRADMMHAEQLLTWASHGSLDLRPVFSRAMGVELPAPVKVVDAKYVQDRVWMEREELRTLYKAGAMFYTCASGSRMALDLKKTLIKIIMEAKGCSEEEAGEKMDSLAQERYRTDVFV
jgi:cytochrome P450/NADPH-cytochrome P450 reductase